MVVIYIFRIAEVGDFALIRRARRCGLKKPRMIDEFKSCGLIKTVLKMYIY